MDNVLNDIKNLANISADGLSIFLYAICFVLTLLPCCSFLANKYKTKLTVLLCALIAALPLSLLAGLRYGVGTDYYNYLEIIHSARRVSSFKFLIDRYLLEPGFSFYIYIISNLFVFDGLVFFAMEYLILFLAFYAFARLYKQLNLLIAVSLYYLIFYNYSLNIIRQSLAMSFILLAISCLLTKKTFFYLLNCCIAFLMHYSAIIGFIFGVIYFIFKRRKIKKKTYNFINIGYMLLAVICSIFVKDILNAVLNMFSSLAKYKRFVVIQPSVTFFSLIKGFILVVPTLLLNKTIKEDTQLVFLRNCMWLYFVVATGIYYFRFIGRLVMYIRLIIIFFVAIMSKKLKRKQRCLFIAYYIGVFALAYYNLFLVNNEADVFPYRIRKIRYGKNY